MTVKAASRNAGSGSPTTGGPEYLLVGFLRRPHGVHGELVMEVHTDFPERLKPNTRVFVGDKHEEMILDGTRTHAEGLLVKFKNIHTPEEAGRFRNVNVFVLAADRPALPEGQYYHHELIGFEVMDEQENNVGTLVDILQTGANDVYVIQQPDGRELLVPVIASVILEIQKEHRIIRVHLLPGLFEESED